MAYQYLFPPTTQFQARTGANLTAGYLRVYYTQTDDRAPTYSDFLGTENQDDIVLDNDGRAVVIVDDTKTYRLEVYTYNGACLFTIDPLSAVGGGGGSGLASVTKIISTDGTVQITTTTSAGTTYFDLSTALSPEASRWGALFGARSVITGDGTWEEIPVITSLGTETYQNGWVVNKDTGYDIAASIEMVNGSSVATKLVEVRFDTEIDGNVVHSQYATIDPSRNIDKASFEWKGDVTEGQIVNGRIFVSSTEALSLGLVSNVLFNEECDGVIGGAGTTYVAGQYVNIDQNVISVTGVQPSGDYTYNSAFSSVQTGLVDLSSTVSGLTGTYIEQSASGLFQPSGDYLSSTESANYLLTSQSSLFQSAGNYQTAGDYAFNSALSSYIPMSSSGEFAPSGDYAYNSSLSDYQPVSGMTAYQPSGDYAFNSAVSGKQDASAMTAYQLSGDYAYNSSLADYQSVSGMTAYQPSGDYAYNSAVSSKADQSSLADYQPVSGMTAYQPSGNYLVPDDITGKADVSSLTAYQEITGMSAYQLSGDYAYNSAVSSKMDASASSEFYPMTGNPSSFLVADDITGKADASALSDYQPVSGMTAYQLSGDYAYNSAVSGKADSSALTAYQEITGMSAYQLSGDYAYNSSLSDYQPVTGMSAYQPSGDYAFNSALSAYQPVSGMTAYAPSGDYADNSALGLKQDASAMTAYQEVSGMTAYQLSGDYYSATNPSGFITGVDLTPYQTTADMSAYQTTADMTAYQPSGDYIYASSLGTGVI